MKTVGRDAVLDEASVSHADQRVTEWKRPRTRALHSVPAPVTVTAVDTRVWTEAMRLAGGDASRIQVHNDADQSRFGPSVTVHNRPWHVIKRKGIPA